jgi:hypothetical protein
MNASAQEQGGAGITEIVELYLRQSSPLEEWLKGTLDKVLRVDRRTDARGDDQATVLIYRPVSLILS